MYLYTSISILKTKLSVMAKFKISSFSSNLSAYRLEAIPDIANFITCDIAL